MKQEHIQKAAVGRQPLLRSLRMRLHWITTGAVLVLWGLHLGGILLPMPPEAAEVSEGLETRRAAMLARTGGASVDLQKERKAYDALKDAVSASYGPLEGAAVELETDITWPASLLKLLRSGSRNEILFLPPKDLVLDVKMGSIGLTWLADGDNNVEVSGWEVQRAVGDGKFGRIASLPGDETTYEDRDVRAGRTYAYRVVAVTSDPSVAADRRRSKPSDVRRDQAASDVRLTLVGGDASAQKARLKVEKWHAGDWSAKHFDVVVGQPIGSRDAGSGIDYGSGRKLASLKTRVEREKRTVDQVTFDATGRVVLQAGVPVREPVEVVDVWDVLEARVTGGDLPPQTLTFRKKR